ncbi:heterodisulfide reductase-related iron-sulfur binding cluster [Bradyrhizobium sp. dw_78]|uniref:heterodisulfide reductase-related iron-sulfur binding cluster n=1 Tax=Bradyrhizobium sp. dw_78 TaxID=2719793 RepID=UPI001BD3F927|nr:heterodisulfide reductase-related iron-sulfur binding cluster [Bradyrhizobium sp. dw_78]
MSDQQEKPSEPTADSFSYAEHFGTMRVLGELLRDPAQRPWLTSVPKDAPHHKYVLWLGCNVLRTVQLAETLDDILNYLKEDFVTLGGPSNCCGIVHESRGDVAVGKNMLQQTMKKFDAFTPEQMLCWCPSCDNQLRTEAQEVVTETAKQRISVTRFLASQLERLNFTAPQPVRIALHYHGGFAEQEEDGRDAKHILSQIPGLSIVDMPPMEGLGRHCADAAIKSFGEHRYPAAMNEWAGEARRRGATHVTTIYHSCHRQLLLAQRSASEDTTLPIVNYLTLMARSLGLKEREDRFAQLAASPDMAAMMQQVEPNIRALSIKPEQARKAVEAQFRR